MMKKIFVLKNEKIKLLFLLWARKKEWKHQKINKNIWVENMKEREKKIFYFKFFSIAKWKGDIKVYIHKKKLTTHIFKFNKKYQRVHFNE